MSAFGKRGVRCDWCGRFSANRGGEYTKPGTVGGAAYIHQAFHGDDDNGTDICEECRDGVCPKCRSEKVVKITPAIPGPDGWGGRCKVCGFGWEMPVSDGADVV